MSSAQLDSARRWHEVLPPTPPAVGIDPIRLPYAAASTGFHAVASCVAGTSWHYHWCKLESATWKFGPCTDASSLKSRQAQGVVGYINRARSSCTVHRVTVPSWQLRRTCIGPRQHYVRRICPFISCMISCFGSLRSPHILAKDSGGRWSSYIAR
jgi:hypothetical protein